MRIAKRKRMYAPNPGDTPVDDPDHPPQFLTAESLDGLGQILLLLEGQHVVVTGDSGALLPSLLCVCRLL